MFRLFYVCSLCFLSVILIKIECKLFPLAVRLPLNGTPAELGTSLWPKPQSHKYNSSLSVVHKDSFSIKYHTSLNGCEQEILEKLWSTKYKHVLFPPKLPYEYPSKNEPQMNLVYFELIKNKRNEQRYFKSCSTSYYPFIQDTQTESCWNFILLNEIAILFGFVT
jgi:hypothetical protein